jgi:hypothetical protein
MTQNNSPAPRAPVFSPLAVLWMVLTGVFSFSAYVVLSAYAPDLRRGVDGGAHALSRSAVGYAGLVRLMQADGETVQISRRILGARDGSGLLILTPGPFTTAGDLFDRSADGRVLVIAPKWETSAQPDNPSWVYKAGLIDAGAVSGMLARRFPGLVLARRDATAPVRLNEGDAPQVHLNPPLQAGRVLTTGPIAQLQTLQAGAGLTPILTDARGGVVLAATHDGRVAILSDPDLLNTHGLKDLATARTALAIIYGLSGDTPTIFDVTLNGFDSPPSLLKLAFGPPFLGATLCLAAASMLMGLHAASRFGAPRRAGRVIAFGKRALADNAAALIRLAKREPAMAGRYLDLNRQAVARALGATRLGGGELDAYLDRLAEKNGLPFRLSTLAAEARAAKTRGDLMRVAHNLHQWRQGMTSGRD